ncbi:MAG: hypothetical protein ABJJ25_13920 [Eudoraea sp.]|uniref:hypothetical protein n=1 Tax=Eudoraea sp. TaxID=1979955 RepID=UPI0032646154
MKKLTLLLVLIFAFLSCEKEEVTDPASYQEDYIIGTTLKANNGQVFTITPSGDETGITDANSIMAAFEQATTAGDGSTVKMTPGTFFIERTIAPWDFVGTFKGAGKDATTIKVIEHGFENAGLALWAVAFEFNLKDRGATMADKVHLTLEGFTLVVTGEIPEFYLEDSANLFGSWHGIFIDTRYAVTYPDPAVKEFIALPAFRDVEVLDIAVIGDGEVNRVADPIFIAGGQGGRVEGNRYYRDFTYSENTGTIRVSDSDFITENGYSKLAIFDQLNSTVTVERVNLIGLSTIGGWFVNNVNTSFKVSRLNATRCPGVSYDGNYSGILSASHCEVVDHPPGSIFAGFEIWDEGSTNTIVLSHNKIHSEDNALWGPLFMNGASNPVITNNTFTGRGPAAMYLGVDFWEIGGNNGLTVVGNNLNGWDTQHWDWLPGIAPIWLGSGTSNCTVVGSGNLNNNVVDDGTGNTLTGVNNQGGSNLGQTVKAAMRQKIDLKNAIMSIRGNTDQ